jgi:tocopherol O-methyltransferase
MTDIVATDRTGGSMLGTAAAVARHYDDLDPFYRDVWGEHVHHGLWRTGRETVEEAVVGLVDHVAEAGALRAGESVVDVGAGYGGTARRLASRFGALVTGVTVSAAQHAYAARAGADHRARILLQDWLANTIASGSADVVIAIESTEHMSDLAHALAEMRRVLRAGGRVGVCAWLAADGARGWQRRWLLEPIAREGRLVTLASAGHYLRVLREAGFDDVAWEDLTPRVSRTWTAAMRRLAHRFLTDPRYLRHALDRGFGERVFLATVPRIALAYATGAMGYGLFTGRRPPSGYCAV